MHSAYLTRPAVAQCTPHLSPTSPFTFYLALNRAAWMFKTLGPMNPQFIARFFLNEPIPLAKKCHPITFLLSHLLLICYKNKTREF